MNIEISHNYISVPLIELFDYVIGGDWGKEPELKDDNYSLVYCIRGSEFKNWNIDKGKTASLRKIKKGSLENRKLKKGDILIEISGGGPDQPVGRTVVIDKSVLSFKPEIPKVCTNFLRLARPSVHLNSHYVNYYLLFFYKYGGISDYQGGSNNLRNLKFDDYSSIEIPIAPYNEQKRIGEKIEEFFSDLDKGVEYLVTTKKQLRIYRQAVLKWAFEGKLTNSNVEDDVLPKGWKLSQIKEVADVGTGATPLKSNKAYYQNGSIPWVTSGALNEEFVSEASDFVTEKAIRETNLTVYSKGTLLLAMYGEGKTRGKCSELLIEACTNQAIAAIYFDNHDIRIKPYLKYFLLKNYYDLRKLASGGVQPNINLSIVKQTEFPVPPTYEEQTQIVLEIERRLSVCDKIEEMIEESLKQADALRYSILKKAFEGRLVLQDPNDEPASVLLQRIKADKEKNKPVKKEREKKPKSRTKMKEEA